MRERMVLLRMAQRMDAFVTKLNPAGSGLVYSTYLGGNERDGTFGIAVDPSGSAYVTGVTGSTTSTPPFFVSFCRFLTTLRGCDCAAYAVQTNLFHV